MLLLEDNPLMMLTSDDIIAFKKILKKQLFNSFILENIKLLKEHNFGLIDKSKNDNMKIMGGNILLKDVITKSLYYRNFLSLKKLNIIFFDQMLTLDGKNMLTFKELFYKQFIKQRLGYQNLIRNSWRELEEEVIENININRKIKKDIFEKLTKKYATNLKGEDLRPIMAAPNAKKFVGTIKEEQ
ncbi:unnamed protein product [Rhizophagus irregularis]|nr:unnamed protein product [Rhizophagus irregularis]